MWSKIRGSCIFGLWKPMTIIGFCGTFEQWSIFIHFFIDFGWQNCCQKDDKINEKSMIFSTNFKHILDAAGRFQTLIFWILSMRNQGFYDSGRSTSRLKKFFGALGVPKSLLEFINFSIEIWMDLWLILDAKMAPRWVANGGQNGLGNQWNSICIFERFFRGFGAGWLGGWAAPGLRA